jgi:endonuclease YncB( thermonuclease family)
MAGVIFVIYQVLILPFMPKVAPYRVAHMIDADSLLVYDGKALKKVQLIGVDAPELTGPQKGHQCFDKEALAEASKYFAKDRGIWLEEDPASGDKDIHGRDLRYVKLTDGKLYNEQLLSDGIAKESNPQDAKYKLRDEFLKTQKDASDKGAGIWNGEGCAGIF